MDERKALSLQLRNQSTVKLFNQNIFIYDPVFYLLNGPDSWKAAGLVSFDCAKFGIMFNLNLTKDFL